MLYVSYELGVERYVLMGSISVEHDYAAMSLLVPGLDSQNFTAILLSSCIKGTNFFFLAV